MTNSPRISPEAEEKIYQAAKKMITHPQLNTQVRYVLNKFRQAFKTFNITNQKAGRFGAAILPEEIYNPEKDSTS